MFYGERTKELFFCCSSYLTLLFFPNLQHHCRNCGDIFCDKCTHGRIALTADENAPQVRVCDRCMVYIHVFGFACPWIVISSYQLMCSIRVSMILNEINIVNMAVSSEIYSEFFWLYSSPESSSFYCQLFDLTVFCHCFSEFLSCCLATV